jgi:dihydropteroate synthase
MDFLRVEDNYFPRTWRLNIKGKLSTISKPIVMGIVNCTPDSFYENSRKSTFIDQQKHIDFLAQAGTDWLDIGGYSSRPGAIDISENEEIDRILPAIEYAKRNHPNLVLSIDTFRSRVAQTAIEQGGHIVNDISGGTLDPLLFSVVGKLNCPLIIMHMRGTPQTMNQHTQYTHLFPDVSQFFSQQILKARQAGIVDILLDPGFGFSKTTVQNFELLKQLRLLDCFNLPILVGISRKSMIYKTLGTDANGALNGTTALHLFALLNGASIIRVHDPKEAREVVDLFELVR